jgi:hypothetical protein
VELRRCDSKGIGICIGAEERGEEEIMDKQKKYEF